jgi:predicted transcriptional regulator
MTQTPCERVRFVILPHIRKELAICLVEQFRCSQRKAAEKLGITPAAVSQYKSKKRAGDQIFTEEFKAEISTSADLINTHGSRIVESELCRLCILFRNNGWNKTE